MDGDERDGGIQGAVRCLVELPVDLILIHRIRPAGSGDDFGEAWGGAGQRRRWWRQRGEGWQRRRSGRRHEVMGGEAVRSGKRHDVEAGRGRR